MARCPNVGRACDTGMKSPHAKRSCLPRYVGLKLTLSLSHCKIEKCACSNFGGILRRHHCIMARLEFHPGTGKGPLRNEARHSSWRHHSFICLGLRWRDRFSHSFWEIAAKLNPEASGLQEVKGFSEVNADIRDDLFAYPDFAETVIQNGKLPKDPRMAFCTCNSQGEIVNKNGCFSLRGVITLEYK